MDLRKGTIGLPPVRGEFPEEESDTRRAYIEHGGWRMKAGRSREDNLFRGATRRALDPELPNQVTFGKTGCAPIRHGPGLLECACGRASG
jgi:hypothetical protein